MADKKLFIFTAVTPVYADVRVEAETVEEAFELAKERAKSLNRFAFDRNRIDCNDTAVMPEASEVRDRG